MRNRIRSLVRQSAAMMSIVLVAACTERPPQAAARTSMTAPATVMRSSTGAPLVLACPALPGIAKRAVAAGSQGDVNGNGIVCDRRGGSAGHERVLTTDDALAPAAAAR